MEGGGSGRVDPRRLLFLQKAGQSGSLHKLLADEIFFYHVGDPMRIGERRAST